MPGAYIPDGYTIPETIQGDDGKTILSFTFRPVRGTLRQQLVTAEISMLERGYAGAKSASAMIAEALADHLVKWDLLDDDQKPVPITSEAVAALDPTLANRLLLKVLYWKAPEEPGPLPGEAATQKN